MSGNNTGRLKAAGLHGKAYQPPPDPAILRARKRTQRTDNRSARELGHAAAESQELADGNQQHYDGLIDEQANEALAETREGHQEASANNDRAAEDARQQQDDAMREIIRIEERDAEDAEVERERSHLRGLGPFAYALILVFCYIVTLPQDNAAATGLPLSPTMQLIVALTIGGVLMLAAHVAGDKWRELEEGRPQRAENPAEYESVKRELVGWIAVPLLVIAAIAVWRGYTFAAEAEVVDGLFSSPMASNVAFALLAVCAFGVATFAARAYCRLKPLREIRGKRAKNAAQRETQQTILDLAERVEAQAELNIEHLAEHVTKTEAKIEAWRSARKQHFHHRAAVLRHKRERRLVNQGALPPTTGRRRGPGHDE
jgi:hypothetical protein